MSCKNRNQAVIRSPIPVFLTDWAARKGIELLPSHNDHQYELFFADDKLQLNWFGPEKFLPIFVKVPKSSRMISTNLLYKAIGKRTKVVHDLTVGMGIDAMTLAGFGKTVFCNERCAPIALLFFDGLRRCPQRLAANIKFDYADSQSWLHENKTALQTLYIDTMFSGKKKTAKSTKSMQILRQLAGDDEDVTGLLVQAMGSRANRVVVKNTDSAAIIGNKPTMQYLGKTIRFDVYVNN